MMDINKIVYRICRCRNCIACPLERPGGCLGLVDTRYDHEEEIVSVFAKMFPDLIDELDSDLLVYLSFSTEVTEDDIMNMFDNGE